MNIGYAQTIITPDLDQPVFLAGFGQNRRAETVHDDLYARVLAIRVPGQTLILCALDLIGIFRRDALEITRRVHQQISEVHPSSEISNPDILIACLHPHHGPDTMGMWGPDDKTTGVDPVYFAGLKDKLVAAMLAALKTLQPVSGLKTTSIQVPGLVKNARDPEVLDNELTLLQFSDASGDTLLSLFNFACHPEVLWEHNPHITADYPGYLRKEAERLSAAPCIFFSADLGGMLTPDVKKHSFEEAEFMGKTLARAGLDALAQAPSLHDFSISVQKKEIDVKLTNLLFKFAMQRGLFPDIRDKQGFIHSEVNLLRIGPLWFASLPGELLPALGMALKADLRQAGAVYAGILGLANDELGYILPKEDFHYPLNPFKPGKRYEETMSISKEIGPVVVAAVRSLLQETDHV